MMMHNVVSVSRMTGLRSYHQDRQRLPMKGTHDAAGRSRRRCRQEESTSLAYDALPGLLRYGETPRYHADQGRRALEPGRRAAPFEGQQPLLGIMQRGWRAHARRQRSRHNRLSCGSSNRMHLYRLDELGHRAPAYRQTSEGRKMRKMPIPTACRARRSPSPQAEDVAAV